MAKKNTINVITAHVDPILGTTYKTEPVATVSTEIAKAQENFKKFKTQRVQKVHSTNTKKK